MFSCYVLITNAEVTLFVNTAIKACDPVLGCFFNSSVLSSLFLCKIFQVSVIVIARIAIASIDVHIVSQAAKKCVFDEFNDMLVAVMTYIIAIPFSS